MLKTHSAINDSALMVAISRSTMPVERHRVTPPTSPPSHRALRSLHTRYETSLGVLAGPKWEAGQRDSSCVPISPIMLWYIDRRPRARGNVPCARGACGGVSVGLGLRAD